MAATASCWGKTAAECRFGDTLLRFAAVFACHGTMRVVSRPGDGGLGAPARVIPHKLPDCFRELPGLNRAMLPNTDPNPIRAPVRRTKTLAR